MKKEKKCAIETTEDSKVIDKDITAMSIKCPVRT